jgi:hypothetical protein
MAQRRSYRKLRHQKCASFWSAEFASADNPRRVCSTVDRLMGRGRRSCDSVGAEALSNFFSSQVDQVRATTSDSSPPSYSIVHDSVSLPAFSAISLHEVRTAIKKTS